MKRYYSDKEIKDELKKIIIIQDTREQVNFHITEYLSSKKIPYKPRKLNVGDYSFMVNDMTFENDVAVERKANIDEIAGNITIDRTRFENEFLRAKATGIKTFLIIENSTWQDLFSHNYKSKLLPQSLFGTLMSWQVKYNITIIFCKQTETARIMYGIFYYWLRDYLERGK